MDAIAVTTALGNAYTALKIIRNASGALKDAEVKMAIADLTSALADVKMRCIDLQEENAELNKAKDIRKNLEMRDLGYYLKKPVEGYAEGPFCPTCMDADGKPISMSVARMPNQRLQSSCGRCKNAYQSTKR